MKSNPFDRLRRLPPGFLVCPDTHGVVDVSETGITCPESGRVFDTIDGLPALLPEGFSFTKELLDEDRFYEDDKHVNLGFAHDLAHTRAREPVLDACRQLGLNKDSWVAIVGAGSGSRDLVYVQSFTKNILTMDISPLAVKTFLAGEPYASCLATAESLPLGTGMWDAIVLCGIMHHVAGYGGMDRYLQEAYRALKPGGGIIIADPNILYPIAAVMRCVDIPAQRIKPGWRHHVPHERPLLGLSVRRAVLRAGFKEAHILGSSFLHNRFPYALSRMVDRLTPLARKPFFRHFGYWIGVLGIKA